MFVRRLFSVVPALALVVACGGETPPAESPVGAEEDPAAAESHRAEEWMGDEMGADEGMGEEEGMGDEGGGDEGAADEGGDEAME